MTLSCLHAHAWQPMVSHAPTDPCSLSTPASGQQHTEHDSEQWRWNTPLTDDIQHLNRQNHTSCEYCRHACICCVHLCLSPSLHMHPSPLQPSYILHVPYPPSFTLHTQLSSLVHWTIFTSRCLHQVKEGLGKFASWFAELTNGLSTFLNEVANIHGLQSLIRKRESLCCVSCALLK